MNYILIFTAAGGSSQAAAARSRESLDDPFYIHYGRPGWNPFSRNNLNSIYPYGYQLQSPEADSALKLDTPYITQEDEPADGSGRSRSGFVLDCESGFAYDACENDSKRVCDAFCQNMCFKKCQNLNSRPLTRTISFGETLEATAGSCIQENNLGSCAYNYGTVIKIGVKQICTRTFDQLRPVDTQQANQIAQVQAVALNLNWTAFTSQNFKSIKRIILQLRHRKPNELTTTPSPSSSESTAESSSTGDATTTMATATTTTKVAEQSSVAFDPDLPEDTTNIVRLMRGVKISSTDGTCTARELNSRLMPIVIGDIYTHQWQRFGTFGIPYYMNNEIYQIDITHLFNMNVWNSVGTDSTIMIWFNTVQKGFEFYQAEDSGAFIFSDFNNNRIFTKGKIKSVNILSIVSQFNDRKSEF